MPLQHDNPEEAARAQRMTAGEAKAVIDLWQQERTELTGLTDRPAVPDVAEGLDIPVEEVQRLLGEVRAHRMKEEMRLAREEQFAEVQTRLAEEEARLADLQQQRAEVQRVTAKAEKHKRFIPQSQGAQQFKAAVPSQVRKKIISSVPLILVWFLLICLILGMALTTSHRAPSQAPSTDGGCFIMSLDGTKHPCTPNFDTAHPDPNFDPPRPNNYR